MAVQDKYVNADIAADKLANPALTQGAKVVAMVATFEVAVADDDGSVYRVIKALQPNLIPISIEINNDVIADATSYDLGLYETDLGAVIDKDVFLAAEDISAGNAIGSEVNGLTNLAPEDLIKKIYEHAGDDVTDYKAGYDLAFTANTVGSALGTITIRAIFIQG